MHGGVRKTIALETREESDAIRMALELANGPDLAIGGTLEGEIEAFVVAIMSTLCSDCVETLGKRRNSLSDSNSSR